MARPKCKKCKQPMFWDGYASMGGSHSNYYTCRECERTIEVYDRDLPEEITETKIVGKEYV